MATLSHVLTLVVGFLAPLIIYLLKKDESIFIIVIALIITLIGVLLLWVVGIVALVFVILATIKASEGKLYKYPFSLRLIK